MKKIIILFLLFANVAIAQHPPFNPKCKEATAWTNQLGTYPVPLTVQAVNQFITWELNKSLWSTYDRFWLFAQDNQTNACVSIANATSTAATQVSSPSWTANQGFTSNGTSSYINTQYTPSTDGVQYTQNGAMFGAYMITNKDEAAYIAGSLASNGSPTTYCAIIPRLSNVYYGECNVNGSFSLTGAVTDTRAFLQVQRTSSTSQTAYYNAGVKYTETITAQNPPNQKIYAGCINNIGTAANFSTITLSILMVGANNSNVAGQYADIQQLATMLGFKQ